MKWGHLYIHTWCCGMCVLLHFAMKLDPICPPQKIEAIWVQEILVNRPCILLSHSFQPNKWVECPCIKAIKSKPTFQEENSKPLETFSMAFSNLFHFFAMTCLERISCRRDLWFPYYKFPSLCFSVIKDQSLAN